MFYFTIRTCLWLSKLEANFIAFPYGLSPIQARKSRLSLRLSFTLNLLFSQPTDGELKMQQFNHVRRQTWLIYSNRTRSTRIFSWVCYGLFSYRIAFLKGKVYIGIPTISSTPAKLVFAFIKASYYFVIKKWLFFLFSFVFLLLSWKFQRKIIHKFKIIIIPSTVKIIILLKT